MNVLLVTVKSACFDYLSIGVFVLFILLSYLIVLYITETIRRKPDKEPAIMVWRKVTNGLEGKGILKKDLPLYLKKGWLKREPDWLKESLSELCDKTMLFAFYAFRIIFCWPIFIYVVASFNLQPEH